MAEHLELVADADRCSADDSRPISAIPDPETFPTISVPAAAKIAGVARRTGYAAAERGEWPVIRIGRSVRVRTRQFLDQYGFLA